MFKKENAIIENFEQDRNDTTYLYVL